MATNTRIKRSYRKSLPNLIAPQGDTTNLVRNEEDGGNLKKKPGEIATADTNASTHTDGGTTDIAATQTYGGTTDIAATQTDGGTLGTNESFTRENILREGIERRRSSGTQTSDKKQEQVNAKIVLLLIAVVVGLVAVVLVCIYPSKETTGYDIKLAKIVEDLSSHPEFLQQLGVSLATQISLHADNIMSSVREEIETFRKAKQQFDTDIENLKLEKKKFEDVLEGYKSSLNTINDIKNALNDEVNIQKTKMYTIDLNTFNKASAIFAIILLYILLMMLAVAHYRLSKRSHDHSSRTSTNGEALIDSVADKPSTDLANVICVISYDGNTQIHHRKLVSAITDGLKDDSIETFRVEYYLIDRHEDIKNIPPAKLYLMCVDFTERNVIIEPKGLGLDDMKRSTYEKVRTFGLVIIYVRDPDSRKLSPHKRYNTDLDCTISQQELKVLNDVGRFFSVYQMFTDFQLQCLRNIVSETFENIY